MVNSKPQKPISALSEQEIITLETKGGLSLILIFGSILFGLVLTFLLIRSFIAQGLGETIIMFDLGSVIIQIRFAAILTYLEEILITKFAEIYMLIFGAILVAAILYLPDGFVGLAQKIWRRLVERNHVNT